MDKQGLQVMSMRSSSRHAEWTEDKIAEVLVVAGVVTVVVVTLIALGIAIGLCMA